MNMVALGIETTLLNSIKPELKSERPQAQNVRKYQKLSKTNTLNKILYLLKKIIICE